MKTMLICFAIAICMVSCRCNQEPPPAAPQLSIVGMQGGDTLKVDVGLNFSLVFMIKNAKDVYGVAAMVGYDTTYLSAVATEYGKLAEIGLFLGDTGDLTTTFMNGVKGNIVFAYSKQDEQAGNNGEGDLWILTLRAEKEGFTQIGFDLFRCVVVSSQQIENGLKILPSKFQDMILRDSPSISPSDTALVYIKI